VKHRPWLIVLLMVCALAGIGGVAHAQANATVTVTQTVNLTVGAGTTVANAGQFTVANNTGSAMTITGVTLAVDHPGLFSSMTMTGTLGGTSQPSTVSPPGSSVDFVFSLAVGNGQTATFNLAAVVSNTPIASAGPRSGHPVYAAISWPAPSGKSGTSGAMLTALAMGILLMTGRLRRRHLAFLALALIMGATELGCGDSISGVIGTSSQSVTALAIDTAPTVNGLPAALGAISVQ
jgi:hypothetical protein